MQDSAAGSVLVYMEIGLRGEVLQRLRPGPLGEVLVPFTFNM
jgi:hypothetical protein